MRKTCIVLSFLLMFLLYGCSMPQPNSIETLKGLSFQFNKETNDFSLFFGFLDKNGNGVSADVDIDIRIVNNNGEEVYRKTKNVSKNDFDYYMNQAAGEQYLANIRIPSSDISQGTSSDGKVYLNVYKATTIRFDEMNCDALQCLPIKDSVYNVETLKSWSFQFNEETNDFSLFFGLLDKNRDSLSANVDIDIRIVNENGEEMYRATKSVSKDDFDYYTSQTAGEQYLANVRIPASDILPGTSSNGKVYLTVYKSDIVRFDEVNCDVLYCLPVKDVQLTCESLPLELNMKDYLGNTESIIQINDVSYNYDKKYSPQLEIIISGVKTYGSKNSDYDIISYKLYDSDGYMIDSGIIYLSALSAGDKFKDNSLVIYDITPGTSYTLKLMEYDW